MARGVWKAPAGLDATIKGAQELVHNLTDTQGGALNGQGVNCLRNIAGTGQVIWGGRTRATLNEPQWRYLPVRRTALMIEDSLRTALLWAVHQPNKQELWSALKINIEAFMDRLHRAGAFQPQSPKDAYFVRCGVPSSMTQADVNAGIVRVAVGFAPVKPAEFVVITIEQISEAG
jgi:phage tail sheath protein FI